MTVKAPQPPPLPDEVDRLLRRLRLPYIRKTAPEVIATAAAQRWEPAEVLRVLLSEEAAGRDRATIAMRRRGSGLPAGKTFDAWEQDTSSIPKPAQQALRTLEWVGRAESLCVCGPSGSGKSHWPIALWTVSSARWRRSSDARVSSFVEALGHLAIDRGKTVAWHTQLIRADLIIIDDVGLLPISPAEAEALFRVVDAAYERRSIALTSNIHPAGFDELMPKDHRHRHRRPATPPRPRARRSRATPTACATRTSAPDPAPSPPKSPDRMVAATAPRSRRRPPTRSISPAARRSRPSGPPSQPLSRSGSPSGLASAALSGSQGSISRPPRVDQNPVFNRRQRTA